MSKTDANLQNSPLSYILISVNKTKNVDNPTVIHKLLINHSSIIHHPSSIIFLLAHMRKAVPRLL